jgi:hypothetical protein
MSFCAAKGNGRVACANKQSTTLAQAQKEDQLISMPVPALNIASLSPDSQSHGEQRSIKLAPFPMS